MPKHIYLDNAATTPVDPAVLKAMQPYFSNDFGNPSAVYEFARKPQQAVQKARKQVADFLNCSPAEIFFTASATESNNWVIYGVVDKLWESDSYKHYKPHIIISAVEHKAVIAPALYHQKHSLADVTFLRVNKEGVVQLEELKKAIKPNTGLISIMYANSEIGSVQPIAEIGRVIKELNRARKNKIFFHTDAVQAINYLDCDVKKLGVDMLSMSGHKIYGPKGIGVLYIKQGTPIVSLIRGGGQEKNMRSGTENVPGIVGLGQAIALVAKNKNSAKNIARLRDVLIKGILTKINDTYLNGPTKNRLANNVNISFKGAEGESIVVELSSRGIYVSTGSACASNSLEPSHILKAINLDPELSHCSVRFTLGRFTSRADIDKVIKILPGIVDRLRKISGK